MTDSMTGVMITYKPVRNAEVEGDAFTAEYSAPSAGPAPWHVYRVQRSAVFALRVVKAWRTPM